MGDCRVPEREGAPLCLCEREIYVLRGRSGDRSREIIASRGGDGARSPPRAVAFFPRAKNSETARMNYIYRKEKLTCAALFSPFPNERRIYLSLQKNRCFSSTPNYGVLLPLLTEGILFFIREHLLPAVRSSPLSLRDRIFHDTNRKVRIACALRAKNSRWSKAGAKINRR